VLELFTPDLRLYREIISSLNLSSSVENTSLKSAQDLKKKLEKIFKKFYTKSLTPKLQRGLQRVFTIVKEQQRSLL
jgi:hypothetical protein